MTLSGCHYLDHIDGNLAPHCNWHFFNIFFNMLSWWQPGAPTLCAKQPCVYSTVNGEIMGYIGAPWSPPSRFSGGNLAPQCSSHLIKKHVNLLVATWRSNIIIIYFPVWYSVATWRSESPVFSSTLTSTKRLRHNRTLPFPPSIYIYGPKGVHRTLPLSLLFHIFSPFSTFQNYHPIIQSFDLNFTWALFI